MNKQLKKLTNRLSNQFLLNHKLTKLHKNKKLLHKILKKMRSINKQNNLKIK